MDQGSSEWVTIYRLASYERCRECSLVLQAAGIVHEVRPEAGEFAILVPPKDVERSRAELEAYEAETFDDNERPAFLRAANGWSGVLGFSLVLLSVFVLEQRHALGFDWLEAGKTDAGLIREGQWWRVVTALTLHDDLAHLMANIVVGSLVGLFLGQSLGSGSGWFFIVIAGISGNLLNAWLRPAGHTSVGASTAVFAAVGFQAVLAWRRRRGLRGSRMERWVPLIGGLLLLSFLGTGGERTDVAAHVLGFACGGALGGIFGSRISRVWFDTRAQILFGVGTLTILAAAWSLALSR